MHADPSQDVIAVDEPEPTRTPTVGMRDGSMMHFSAGARSG